MADEEVKTVEGVLNEQYEVGQSMFADEVVGEAPVEDEAVEDVAEEEEATDDVIEEEDDDSYDEEGEDEEANSEDDEPEDDTESSVAQLEEVNSNLKRAVQSERQKRKQAAENVANLEAQIDLLKGQGGDKYTKLVEQIKELGLEDVLEVQEEPALDPRVQKMLEAQEAARQQEQQQQALEEFTTTMQSEVQNSVANYKNIDTNNEVQGSALAQMIVADVIQGMEVADATEKNLKVLDAMLAPSKAQPRVVPKKKVRSATKSTKDVSSRRKAKQIQDGDMSSVFADIGKRLAGEL